MLEPCKHIVVNELPKLQGSNVVACRETFKIKAVIHQTPFRYLPVMKTLTLNRELYFKHAALTVGLLLSAIYFFVAADQLVGQSEPTNNASIASLNSDDDGKKKFSLADIPEGITSFGGAIANNKLYVFGGHTGTAHSYYESGQNKTLFELDLAKPTQWNKVADGLGLQGLAMVSHGGKLYRLGGFHAHNKEGEKHDLRSVADFAVFDFTTKKWNALTPMPTGRSSFDAVVVGDLIYVIGGWKMNGTKGTEWIQSAISIDLSKENPKWTELPEPPFQRRALSVGCQNNKIVAIGGMQQKGGPTKKVAIYDPATKIWSDGPSLPEGDNMEGFGSSCFLVGDRLVVSTYGGNVYRLDKAMAKWEKINTLESGRFFHRLLPLNDQNFVLVGGASMETGKFYELEVLSKN